jgi:hypothetical protein
MLIFILNRNFLIEILMFRFENNNLKFKYQFVDQIIFLNLNKNFQN